MKFKIDENLPCEVAELLRVAGYDAMTVMEQQLNGKSDPTIAIVCQQEDRILVTLDLDFANIHSYPPDQFPGFIVLRLKQQDKPHILAVFRRVISMFAVQTPDLHLWIVDESRIKIRG